MFRIPIEFKVYSLAKGYWVEVFGLSKLSNVANDEAPRPQMLKCCKALEGIAGVPS